MKHRAPQFELAGAEVAFNLKVETTGDGWKRAKEREETQKERERAQKQQPILFDDSNAK